MLLRTRLGRAEEVLADAEAAAEDRPPMQRVVAVKP
jgi:hypothetical protein